MVFVLLIGLLLKTVAPGALLAHSWACRRFVKTIGSGNFSIDYDKAEADAKFDGLFVLRTNTKLSALQVALSELAGGGRHVQNHQGAAHHAAKGLTSATETSRQAGVAGSGPTGKAGFVLQPLTPPSKSA